MGPDHPAIVLLERTVRAMELRGQHTAAAGVSARMVQDDPTFSPRSSGFRSFRALLTAARELGIVRLTLPDHASDVTVHTTGFASGGTADAELPANDLYLRQEIWRAIQGRHTEPQFYWRSAQSVGPMPEGGETGNDAVALPLVSDQTRLEWARAFAEAQTAESTRELLIGALAAEDPQGAFRKATTNHRSAGRRWKEYFRLQSFDLVKDWASEHAIPLSALTQVAQSENKPANSGPSNTGGGLQGGAPATSPSRVSGESAELRNQILEAIGRMPLHELLRLPIPVEYVLRR